MPSNRISTFPASFALKDTLFNQQQKYKIVSYLEPDLREIAWQLRKVSYFESTFSKILLVASIEIFCNCLK